MRDGIRQAQHASMDSGIQDVMSTHDYVNINALHLEISSILASKRVNRLKPLTSSKRRSSSDSDYVTHLGPGLARQEPNNGHVNRATQDSSLPGVTSGGHKSGRTYHSSDNPSATGPINTSPSRVARGRGLSKTVDLRKTSVNKWRFPAAAAAAAHTQRATSRSHHQGHHYNQQTNNRSSLAAVKDRVIATSSDRKTAGCRANPVALYRQSRHDSRLSQVSDIYEQQFEAQLESLDLERAHDGDSFTTAERCVTRDRGWCAGSSVSDPMDLSGRLELVNFDDDTAYDSGSDMSTLERTVSSKYRGDGGGLRSSDTFKYRVRQHLSPREQVKGSPWRVVIPP